MRALTLSLSSLIDLQLDTSNNEVLAREGIMLHWRLLKLCL